MEEPVEGSVIRWRLVLLSRGAAGEEVSHEITGLGACSRHGLVDLKHLGKSGFAMRDGVGQKSDSGHVILSL